MQKKKLPTTIDYGVMTRYNKNKLKIFREQSDNMQDNKKVMNHLENDDKQEYTVGDIFMVA